MTELAKSAFFIKEYGLYVDNINDNNINENNDKYNNDTFENDTFENEMIHLDKITFYESLNPNDINEDLILNNQKYLIDLKNKKQSKNEINIRNRTNKHSIHSDVNSNSITNKTNMINSKKARKEAKRLKQKEKAHNRMLRKRMIDEELNAYIKENKDNIDSNNEYNNELNYYNDNEHVVFSSYSDNFNNIDYSSDNDFSLIEFAEKYTKYAVPDNSNIPNFYMDDDIMKSIKQGKEYIEKLNKKQKTEKDIHKKTKNTNKKKKKINNSPNKISKSLNTFKDSKLKKNNNIDNINDDECISVDIFNNVSKHKKSNLSINKTTQLTQHEHIIRKNELLNLPLNSCSPDLSLSDVVLKVQSLDRAMPIDTDFTKRKIRQEVWTEHNGSAFESPCFVDWCTNIINVFNYQVGHDIPKSKGGPNTLDNLKPICESCNQSMGNKYTIKEWNKLFEIPEQKKELVEKYKYQPLPQLSNVSITENKVLRIVNEAERQITHRIQNTLDNKLNSNISNIKTRSTDDLKLLKNEIKEIREIKEIMTRKITAIDDNQKTISKIKGCARLFALGAGLTLTTSLYIYYSILKFTT
jgi:5-methylcytosine-specific restriction endonuclease McrA